MVLVLDCILMVRSVSQGWKIWSDKLRSILRLRAFSSFSDCVLFLFTYSKYILRIRSLFPYRKFLKTISTCIYIYTNLYTLIFCQLYKIFPFFSQIISWKWRELFHQILRAQFNEALKEASSEKPEVLLWETAMLFQSKENSKRRTSDVLTNYLALSISGIAFLYLQELERALGLI